MSETESEKLYIEKANNRGLSPVWFVPIIAAILGGLVAWQSLANQGPLVEIAFNQAKGIQADKTEIKHKDVIVGIVEDVSFSEGFDSVIVTARLDPEIEPYLGETTDFWVVSANISGTDLTGLSTILSGSYIEVDWSSEPKQHRRRFEGLSKQPLTPPSAEGRHVILTAPMAGSVNVGSPVYFRGVSVGRVESRGLSEDYRSIEYSAFIEAPYDQLITRSSQFWNVSGVSVDAGADGLSINLASLESLLSGGVAFGQVGTDISGEPFEENARFRLFRNRQDAVESQFETGDDLSVRFALSFDSSVAGLEPGAPVEWQGIRIGTVVDLQLSLDAEAGANIVDVIIELQPSRIGLEFSDITEGQKELQDWVNSGMRVRLATGNILTGRKLIQFIDGIGTGPAPIDFSELPYPRLPTAPSELDAIAENAEDLVANLADLPLEDLVVSAVRLLDNANAFVASPDMQQLPGELSATLSSVDRFAINLNEASRNLPALINNLNQIADAGESTLSGLSPDSQLYVDLSGAVRDLRDAARSLSALAVRLEEQPNALIVGRN
ncbi:MAG: MlaD family protein [Pseudomonadota bacterium]